jgi:hexosaminidase
MGVRNRQKRRWLTGVFAVIISVLVVLFTRSVSDFNERELSWADINGVIPAVTMHSLYDSVGYNYLSPKEGDWEMEFDSTLASEQYFIVSDGDGVQITYGPNGDHHARATLFQLTRLTTEGAKLPYGRIDDRPAFRHRGVLLDVCRHFFTVEEVKRQLDIMALYKFNVFHWHLTEDQGWRIAMDKYPKLAEVAAFRMYGDSVYGGSYSRKQLEDVVAHARGLGIEIIPEIELPGHSQAAIAAYPELGCTGKPLEVATEWGVFKDIYCAGNEQTFEFLEDVLDYVCEIFPSKYIHIGGDEAPKYRWEHCAKCQQRIKNEGLKTEEELQSWFNIRIEDYVATKGKQIIGWDEILEGGLSPNATVQSWRGFEGGIQAAEQGHDAIMSPTSHAYFDYPISSIDVPKVYAYDPVPQDLDPMLSEHILGGECNLWSECIPNIETLDRRFLPRGLAMAEVLWSYPQERNYEAFWNRLQQHYSLLEAMGYSYDLEQVPVDLQSYNESSEDEIELHVIANPAFENLELDVQSSTGVVIGNRVRFIDAGVHSVSVQPKRDDRPMGPLLEYDFALHQGLLTHSCLTSPPTPPYSGTPDISLANGVLGSTNFRDGNWLGYFGPDFFSGHFEWKEKYIIDSVKINFLQSRLSWILIPEVVYTDIYVQSDVIERYHWDRDVSVEEEGTFIHTMTLAPTGGFSPTNSIHFEIPNTERLAINHPAAGQRVWHFLDEVQIYGRPYRN